MVQDSIDKGKPMRKLAFASIIAAFLLPKNALANNAEGIIKSVDEAANTLTLNDGVVYKLPGEFDYSAIHEGMRVLLFYDTDNSGRYVTDIEAADSNEEEL